MGMPALFRVGKNLRWRPGRTSPSCVVEGSFPEALIKIGRRWWNAVFRRCHLDPVFSKRRAVGENDWHGRQRATLREKMEQLHGSDYGASVGFDRPSNAVAPQTPDGTPT
jgi:hypothetical protein